MDLEDIDFEEMFEKYAEQYENVSEKLFKIFEELGFPMEIMVDFLITTLASLCVFSERPMKDAKDIGRILSQTVKELMKDGYGSKLAAELEMREAQKR